MYLLAFCNTNVELKKQIKSIIMEGNDPLPIKYIFIKDGAALLPKLTDVEGQIAIFLSMDPLPEAALALAQEIHHLAPHQPLILHPQNPENYFQAYQVPHYCFIADNDFGRYFPVVLNKLSTDWQENLRSALTVKYHGKKQTVEYHDILYLRHSSRSTFIKLTGGEELIIKLELDAVAEKLDFPPFWRCHKSYCVNWDHVRAFRRDSYLISNGETIPISRSRQEESRQAFAKYLESHQHGAEDQEA